MYKEEHCLKRDQFTNKSIILCEAKANRTKEKADKSIITVEDFNTLFSVINRTSSKCIKTQQVYRKTAILINKVDITDIYRTLNSTVTEYAFLFKCSGNIYQDRSYLDHKTNLRKVSRLCVLVSPFPEHLLHSNRTSVFLKTHLIKMRASLVAQW